MNLCRTVAHCQTTTSRRTVGEVKHKRETYSLKNPTVSKCAMSYRKNVSYFSCSGWPLVGNEGMNPHSFIPSFPTKGQPNIQVASTWFNPWSSLLFQESTLHLVLRLRGGHCQVPCGAAVLAHRKCQVPDVLG